MSWLVVAVVAGVLGTVAACTCPAQVFFEAGAYTHTADPYQRPDDVDRTLDLDLEHGKVRISYHMNDQTVVETWDIVDRQPPE